ncbi:MAG: PDZ domain-containing protein [Gemmatimonadaceae bacterium]
MRLTHLIALATVSSAAAAQEPVRVRVATPSVYRYDTDEPTHRAAIGIGTTATGTLRDTLGLMITSVTKGSPAEKAGLEEGNRIAAINGVSLRVNAADVEDGEISSALTRRLTRELAKSKPGDDVELRVYRDGKTSTIKLKTADSDELFKRVDYVRQTKSDMENRPALGFSIGSTGSRRDTLGVLVMSVSDSSPASKAGIEEGNRIAAIGGVNLRVPREDAGDRYLSSTKAQRLQREISALKVGETVTLRVYSNGQFRDVSLKVARAGDLPKGFGGMMFLNGDGFIGGMMAPMPSMPSMPSMPRIAPMPAFERFQMEMPEFERAMENVRVHLDDIAPRIERIERLAPNARMQLDNLRPQLERLRIQAPRIRMVNVIV